MKRLEGYNITFDNGIPISNYACAIVKTLGISLNEASRHMHKQSLIRRGH
jgi:hypothetical protein